MCIIRNTIKPQVSARTIARIAPGFPFLIWLVATLLGFPTFCLSQPSQDSLVQQAMQLEQDGKLQEGEELWAKLAANDPTDFTMQANLGLALSRLHRYGEAAAAYRRALHLSPHRPEIQFNLGLAEFKQGHFAEAVQAFRASTTATTVPKSQIEAL
jgi:Flp pilus assembly protein TadD